MSHWICLGTSLKHDREYVISKQSPGDERMKIIELNLIVKQKLIYGHSGNEVQIICSLWHRLTLCSETNLRKREDDEEDKILLFIHFDSFTTFFFFLVHILRDVIKHWWWWFYTAFHAASSWSGNDLRYRKTVQH